MKLLENVEPDSASIAAFATAAEQTSLVLFELYLALSELAKYKIYVNERFVCFSPYSIPWESFSSQRSNLKLTQYYVYFAVAVKKWLVITRNKLLQRIEYVLDKDKTDLPNSPMKFTSSSIEICQCFTQITQFWRRLAWPDTAGSIVFLIQLIDDVANATRRYASLSEEKLNAKKFYDTNDLSFYTSDVRDAVEPTLDLSFVLAFVDGE